jgi:DNA polymerase-3 subunit delta
VPAFKPAYLIHGDDHGRIAERRARLRALAEGQSGAQGIELFEGERATPEAVALALSSLTFALGRRFLIVDGVERWKEKELEPVERALQAIAPETTVAFFAREDSRVKAPERLHKAVAKAGGDIAAEVTVKPWQLPRWAVAQARELGLKLDANAAVALVAHVGERQQRLLRELEKLALGLGEGASIGIDEVQELTAPSAERRVWSLADAIVAGDGPAALREYVALRAQGERVPGLMYSITQRVRTALGIAEAIQAGAPAGEVRRGLRMPPKAAERLIADSVGAGVGPLRLAVEELADLEHVSRGGVRAGTNEDSHMVLAITRIAAG